MKENSIRSLYTNASNWERSVAGKWSFYGIPRIRIIAVKSANGWTSKIRWTRIDPIYGNVDDFVFGVAASRWESAKRAYDNFKQTLK